MTEQAVLLDSKDGVLTITLNRPKANAFNRQLTHAVRDGFEQAERDSAIRCVVLTADGKLFSAGQDVEELREVGDISLRQHLEDTYNPLILQIRQLKKPTLAAINGAVAGAALGIVLACDLRIASDNTRFIVGFLGIGLVPDSAVSRLLPTLIGLGRASEAAFFNQPIDAEQALAWGLVNKVVSAGKLKAATKEWAQKLAHGPVAAMGLTKQAFNYAVLPGLEAILDYEAQLQEVAARGAEHQEGLAAFSEKRQPDFIQPSE